MNLQNYKFIFNLKHISLFSVSKKTPIYLLSLMRKVLPCQKNAHPPVGGLQDFSEFFAIAQEMFRKPRLALSAVEVNLAFSYLSWSFIANSI